MSHMLFGEDMRTDWYFDLRYFHDRSMVDIITYSYKVSGLIHLVGWAGDVHHGFDIEAPMLKNIQNLKHGQLHDVVQYKRAAIGWNRIQLDLSMQFSFKIIAKCFINEKIKTLRVKQYVQSNVSQKIQSFVVTTMLQQRNNIMYNS